MPATVFGYLIILMRVAKI